MNNYRIMYLRNSKGSPIGCLAIDESRSGTVSFQYSVLNPIDNFKRELSRYIAIGRLVEKPIHLSVCRTATRHEVSRQIMSWLANDQLTPSRARRSAAAWLRTNADKIAA